MKMRSALQTEWVQIFLLAILVTGVAKLVIFGSSLGFADILQYPLGTKGDALFTAHFVASLQRGWINVDTRSGYPFGSELYDFPMSDGGGFLLMKAIGSIVDSPLAVLNIVYMLSFPAVFIVASRVYRLAGLAPVWAYSAAVVFTFLPFHMMRFAHIMYTLYFTVPVYFYAAYRIALRSGDEDRSLNRAFWIAALAASACFGIYNAAFGVNLLVFAAIFSAASRQNWKPLFGVAPYVLAIIGGVLLNLAPNILYWATRREGGGVAARLAAESETYGLKFVQLVLPIENHWISHLADLQKAYNQSAPLITENTTSSLGLIGMIGLILMALVVLFRLAGREGDRRLAVTAYLLLVLLFFGIIGGGGAIFAYLISPMLRGWNRISVFIGFAAILLFYFFLQDLWKNRFLGEARVWASPAMAAFLAVVGMLDQTGTRCHACLEMVREADQRDQNFVDAVSRLIPPDGAVYQLPYTGFPEAPPRGGMYSYEHFVLTTHSPSLKSNYGVMHSSKGDVFFKGLETRALSEQVVALRRLGFRGIWINRRGYADDGAAIIEEATRLFGHGPDLSRDDGAIVFFVISNPLTVDFKDKTPDEIIAAAGAGNNGSVGNQDQPSRIDFNKGQLPAFVMSLQGLSGVEPWGRWTDADASKTFVMKFKAPLPDGMTVRMKLLAFGPNTGKSMTVRLGKQVLQRTLASGDNIVDVVVNAAAGPVEEIELTPFAPTSPHSLGNSTDKRKLGIGLKSMEFLPAAP